MSKSPQQHREAIARALKAVDAAVLDMGRDYANASDARRADIRNEFRMMPNEENHPQPHFNFWDDLEADVSAGECKEASPGNYYPQFRQLKHL